MVVSINATNTLKRRDPRTANIAGLPLLCYEINTHIQNLEVHVHGRGSLQFAANLGATSKGDILAQNTHTHTHTRISYETTRTWKICEGIGKIN